MGHLRPRYNAKGRASCHTTKTAKPHPNARNGGIDALRKKIKSKIENKTQVVEQNIESVRIENIDQTNIIQENQPKTSLEDILSQLPVAPEGKISRMKKKRLEKFIVRFIFKTKITNTFLRKNNF